MNDAQLGELNWKFLEEDFESAHFWRLVDGDEIEYASLAHSNFIPLADGRCVAKLASGEVVCVPSPFF
jgi:hypothetical protein